MAQTAVAFSPLQAYDQIMRFAAQRGENALRLAFHAAVPQTLRPDLLHLLRLNFVPESINDPALESDVLLSTFCEDLGNNYYRLDENVRLQLLQHLDPAYENDKVFRSQKVAQFLLAYFTIQERNLVFGSDHVFNAYVEIERWVALSFFDSALAANQLASAIKQSCDSQTVAARMRIGKLASALSVPLAEHQKLLAYAAGIEALESGAKERARELLENLGDNEIQVGSVSLRAPHRVLKDWLQKQDDDTTLWGREEIIDRNEEDRSVEPDGQEQLAEVSPENSKRDKIFISYSLKDKKWFEKLTVFLQPFIRQSELEIWADTDISAGSKWKTEILEAIGRARVAIALVSSDYLASGFITDMELPKLLEKAGHGDLSVTWIAISHCNWRNSPLSRYQALNDVSKPLSVLRPAQRDRELTRIATRIAEFLAVADHDEEAQVPPDVPQEEQRLGIQVYLSSTYEDLKDYRQAVYETLLRGGYRVIAMEDYVASDQRPVNECLDRIASTDIYLGLFGFRYGYIPPPSHNNPDGLSITELEFRHAKRLGKPCLLFMVSDEAGWPSQFVDAIGDSNSGGPIYRLREYLHMEHIVSTFSSAHELTQLVLDGVTRYVHGEKKSSEERENKDGLLAELGNQAQILKKQGRLEEALALHKKQEALCEALGNQDDLQACYGNQALILKAWGQLEEAMALLKKQEALCVELGNKDSLQISYGNQALILKAWGQLEEAMALHKKKEALCVELGLRSSLGYCYWNWGLLARELNEPDTEQEKLKAALQIFTDLKMPKERDAVQKELENMK